MKKYTVQIHQGQIRINYDGKPIELIPLFSFSTPPYEFGQPSEGSTNLAHAILYHCRGKETTEQLCQDFATAFIIKSTVSPFEITKDEIETFVNRMCKVKFETQEASRKATVI